MQRYLRLGFRVVCCVLSLQRRPLDEQTLCGVAETLLPTFQVSNYCSGDVCVDDRAWPS